jgi:hypothetical protein
MDNPFPQWEQVARTAFNGKLRAECLNAHWFLSLDDAVRKCEAWRRDYNEGSTA